MKLTHESCAGTPSPNMPSALMNVNHTSYICNICVISVIRVPNHQYHQ